MFDRILRKIDTLRTEQREQSDELRELLIIIVKNQTNIMLTLQDILAKVQAEETVEASIIALLTTVKSELDAAIASGDPTQLQALSDKLDADTKAMSDAVVANTPAQTTNS